MMMMTKPLLLFCIDHNKNYQQNFNSGRSVLLLNSERFSQTDHKTTTAKFCAGKFNIPDTALSMFSNARSIEQAAAAAARDTCTAAGDYCTTDK